MDFKRFIPITKVDGERRMVYGYASTPELDSQGEIVSIGALKKALPDYMQFPAIRSMHQPIAAGSTKSANVSDEGLYIGGYISDDKEWKKCKDGTYRGFSLGGRIRQKIDNIIKDLSLTEISLVDVPANRSTVFTLVKREGGKLVPTQESWIEQQQAMINKWTITGQLRKGVSDVAKAKNKIKEEVLEEAATEEEAEEAPQTPEKAPEAPEEEVAETPEEETEETVEAEVSEESPQETVVDETPQSDVSEKLAKLEKSVVTPKATKEEVALAKVMARYDSDLAKVANILDGLKERVEKIEAIAAPVKAKPTYLVDDGSSGEEPSAELAKIDKELADLSRLRDKDINKFRREDGPEKARELFDQRRKLAG